MTLTLERKMTQKEQGDLQILVPVACVWILEPSVQVCHNIWIKDQLIGPRVFLLEAMEPAKNDRCALQISKHVFGEQICVTVREKALKVNSGSAVSLIR